MPRRALYLNNITPLVTRMDEALKDYFDGRSAAAELKAIRLVVDSTSTTQELALPAETLQVYEAKGRVLEMIEDINRLGKNAFEDAPEMARQFNKAILARAKRRRSDEEEEAPPEKGAGGDLVPRAAVDEDPTIEEVMVMDAEASAPEPSATP